MMPRNIIILAICAIILLVLYYFPEIYKTALVVMGWTEMNVTVLPTSYVYDISVECLQDTIQTGQSVYANITITNNGVYEDDVNILWWIEDAYGTNYTSGSTVANISYGETWASTKSLLVPSTASVGIYYFKVNLNVDTYSSTVHDTFEVQVAGTTIPAPTTGVGGGWAPVNVTKEEVVGPEKIANLEVLYDKELMVFPGIPKIYEIEIKNSGNILLHNMNLLLQGIELSWFFIEPESVNLSVNESIKFKINYSLPDYAPIKKYPISILVKSEELEKRIYSTINVIEILDKIELENRLNTLEKEISDLEKKIDELRDKGFPVDSFYRMLYDAKGRVELAKKEMEIGNLDKASELIKYVEITIDSIKETISEITPIQTRMVWSILLVTITLVAVFLLSIRFIEQQIKKLSKFIGRIKL